MSKRIIAFILAFTTLLGCTAFAWEEASSKSEKEYAMELLYALDIMDMVTENGYQPDQVLTRAELADVILRLNRSQDTATYSSCFADVDESTDYAASIATLTSLGVIAKDVYYNPEANAKFEHAVKMIVYTLGYGIVTEAQGGWLEPIMNVARNSGVTKGVSVTTGTDLTAEMLAVLVYNSLDCEMLKRKSIDEFETIKGETLLLNKFEMRKTEGIVTANGITTLTDSASSSGRASIDWYEYEDADQVLAPYIGMEVEAYYTDDDEEIVFGYPTDRNYIKTIDADDILPDASGFSYEAICYREVKEGSTSARVTKAKVEAEADVIYNGKAHPAYTVDDFKIENGQLILIDNDGDKVAEVVIIEESVNYVVESVNTTDMEIYDLFGGELELEDAEFVEIYDMYGAATTLSNLVKWNVLSVLQSADGEYVKIVAYNDPVTGEVESVWDEDGETWVTIDGDTFAIADSYLAAVASGNANAKEIVLGQSGTYYLDAGEKIAAVNKEIDSSWQYAYLIKAQITDDWGVRYRLLMDQTGFKWYDGAETIRIDEVKKEDEDRKTAFDDDNEVEDARKTVPQLVKVQMNGQGQIKKIDTAFRSSRETDDSLTRVITTYAKIDADGDGTKETTDTSMMYEYWSVRTGRFGVGSSIGVYVHPNNTFVVIAPTDEASLYDETNYQIKTGNFENNKDLYYNAYDVDWAGIASAAVVYQGVEANFGQYGAGGTLMFVNSVTSKLNDDDEIVKEITGYNESGVEVTVPVDRDFNITADKGDIIRYLVDVEGEINAAQIDFDYSTQKNFATVTNFTYSSGDSSAAYRGNSQKCINGNVIIDKNGGYIKAGIEGLSFEDITDDMPYSQTQIFSLADATILLYDSVASASTRFTKLSANDLNKYLYGNNPEARVMLYSTYTQLRLVVVYI